MADTVHLRGRGSEINGTVTFANGAFYIEARFEKATRSIAIGSNEISEIRLNDVRDNPGLDDAPDWMKNLPKDASAKATTATLRFKDPDKKDLTGILGTITRENVSLMVGVSGALQQVKLSDLRSVIIPE